MTPVSPERLALGISQHLAPVRLTLRLGAAGWAAAACVWCGTVGAVGVLGHGADAQLALGVLGASGLAAGVMSVLPRRVK